MAIGSIGLTGANLIRFPSTINLPLDENLEDKLLSFKTTAPVRVNFTLSEPPTGGETEVSIANGILRLY